MKKLVMVVLGLVVAALSIAPAAQADSLQSVLFNLNGTQYTDYTVPGMNVGGFNQTTGVGTITLTFTGAPGSYFFDAFFDNQLTPAFFNEYATAVGTPAAGQSWEIGDSFLSSVYPDTQGNTLSNTNNLPGTADNFHLNCFAANCNGDAAMAMGFAFTLGASQQALITLALSGTAPASGFYLDQTHPIDAGNPSKLDLFYSGSVAIQPTGGPPPPQASEPASLLLMAPAMLFVSFLFRRKLRAQS